VRGACPAPRPGCLPGPLLFGTWEKQRRVWEVSSQAGQGGSPVAKRIGGARRRRADRRCLSGRRKARKDGPRSRQQRPFRHRRGNTSRQADLHAVAPRRRLYQGSHQAVRQGQHRRPAWVLSDALACFLGLQEAGMRHIAIATGSGQPKNPLFKGVNTDLGNVKNAILGTCRPCDPQHADRYLAAYGMALQSPLRSCPKCPAPRTCRRRNRPGALPDHLAQETDCGNAGVIRTPLREFLG